MNAVAESYAASTTSSRGPAIIAQPTSPQDIIQILTNPRRYPAPVRPRGSGSAVTRCSLANGGTLIDLSKMNRVLSIGEDTVTVQPGIQLPELADILNDQGMELVGGFDLANRTVGGAVCSAGLEATAAGDFGQFAGHATQIKVINAQGRKFVVTTKTKSLLSLLRLSYGLLGIVYEITLRIRPIQCFSVANAKISFRDFSNLGHKLHSAKAGLKLHLLPFKDCIYFEMRKLAGATDAGKKYSWRLKDWANYTALPGAARSLARALPISRIRYPLMDNLSQVTQSLVASALPKGGSNATEQSGRYRSLAKNRFHYCTWAFPAAEFGHLTMAFKLFSKEHYARTGFRCDMPAVSFRMNKDRSALLSPSFDGTMFTISALSTQTEGWDDYVLDFADFAMSNYGVPLFNQTRNATTEHVFKCFGNRLHFFNRVRRELDPGDRLLNQYFSTYFGT
jgi:hypothetical protein